ncbi:nuclear pore complex protein Nup214-like isoform X2 [Contarinia nasturtii]|uniref:nuclear pore complex protein Nup214-like isoform X2 n=1 Tax=Contarinia nasturtii TaxID=265458 RepID=UPI0012D3CD4D|nr:nuclear pore complex protein Nup214-like isoform X2 [Contarinia nasturtii]
MALQEAPVGIVTDIQFKVHSKYQLFNVNESTPNYNGIDLLAAASTFGLIIVGRPTAQEIQVLRLKDVTENKESPTIPTRIINLPAEPYMLAVSCDHSMLSVCYTVNGTTFIDIYAVQSFLSTNVQCILSKIMVSNANSVKVNQILWNPVIANTMALCLSDGTLTSYVIEANRFEFNALDKAENACCACWSPEGKQIVVAFPNGKLAQYKLDLKLAKAIPCATQILAEPFYPIAIKWLSTYQFAVVFVKEEANQSLFIMNTSETAPPNYINYYDMMFSQPGPRAPQVFLVHILQWNILLMASSNGTEIGILGTTESGENPLWKKYTLTDEGHAALPLTADKQDTFPIGLALETGCTHQLTIGKNLIPVMPMLHILSTHGFISSFNMLNFQPNRVDICSPPQNISDQSGLGFFKQNTSVGAAQKIMTTPPLQQPNATRTSSSNDFHVNNATFAIPETTEKTKEEDALESGAEGKPHVVTVATVHRIQEELVPNSPNNEYIQKKDLEVLMKKLREEHEKDLEVLMKNSRKEHEKDLEVLMKNSRKEHEKDLEVLMEKHKKEYVILQAKYKSSKCRLKVCKYLVAAVIISFFCFWAAKYYDFSDRSLYWILWLSGICICFTVFLLKYVFSQICKKRESSAIRAHYINANY